MKLLETGPETDLNVELEMAFHCSAVVEAVAGLELYIECVRHTVNFWIFFMSSVNGQVVCG